MASPAAAESARTLYLVEEKRNAQLTELKPIEAVSDDMAVVARVLVLDGEVTNPAHYDGAQVNESQLDPTSNLKEHLRTQGAVVLTGAKFEAQPFDDGKIALIRQRKAMGMSEGFGPVAALDHYDRN